MFSAAISFVEEKHDVMVLASADGTLLNIYVESRSDRETLMSSLLQSRKAAGATILAAAQGPSSAGAAGGGKGPGSSNPSSKRVLRSHIQFIRPQNTHRHVVLLLLCRFERDGCQFSSEFDGVPIQHPSEPYVSTNFRATAHARVFPS